jgi:chromosome segregation ATPase
MHAFLLVGGVVSVLSVGPLVYLALRSVREAHELRLIQYELATLMREAKETGEEVHQLQREIRRDQEAAAQTIEQTRRTVEQAAEQVTDAGEQTAGQIAEAASNTTGSVPQRIRRRDQRGLATKVGDAHLAFARHSQT